MPAMFDQTPRVSDPFSVPPADATVAFADMPERDQLYGERLFGLQDVAARWGCTVVDVRKAIPSGLPFRVQPNGQYAVTEPDLLAFEKRRNRSVRRGKSVSRITTGILAIVLAAVVGGLGYLLVQAWNSMNSIANGPATATQVDPTAAAGDSATTPSAAGSSAGGDVGSPQSIAAPTAPAPETPATGTPSDQAAPQAPVEEQAPSQQLQYHVNSENDASHTYPDYLYERQTEIPAASGGSWHVNHFYVTETPTGAERGYVITSEGNRIDVETGGGFSMSHAGAPCYVHSPEEVASLGLDYHWYVLDASGAEVPVY